MTRKTNRCIPKPPAKDRIEPLPWHQPKPLEDDPDAPHRVHKIMTSPSYRQADEDFDFLQSDPVRPTRLQLDFLKPELLMQDHGIKHTIVVFGSTRIVEPVVAKRRVQALTEALNNTPHNETLKKRLAIAKRIQDKSRYYDVAHEFGQIVGKSGHGAHDCRLLIMTGGGPGMMEAANRGAYDVGSKTIGLNITLPHEQYPNPYITPELCFKFHYFACRKMHFLLRAKALVVFPGGYGTLDELFETLTLIQTRSMPPVPIILVGENYWKQAVNFDFLMDEGVIDPEDLELFWFAETAEDIWGDINNWYLAKGETLFNC
ncbi:TIGR00730 family Rossman fold protein [methane-oxidizing endosymbiont of Gigantopelta aegis]|uniref:LOG family protein n=1 Tax=methane-oxidizing endosymbiont of Gigantopelta aegis TaxID=2794938 RepID=UPI0018DC1478|nr:TIGR00730 family Rossman fold protein [methane-oxidizing endosymbiont of Gigantopelta aegis]